MQAEIFDPAIWKVVNNELLAALATLVTADTKMQNKCKKYQAITLQISDSTIPNLPQKMWLASSLSAENKIHLSLLM
eukprot:8706968-Ditylum_brightwellii.AAC.1